MKCNVFFTQIVVLFFLNFVLVQAIVEPIFSDTFQKNAEKKKFSVNKIIQLKTQKKILDL